MNRRLQGLTIFWLAGFAVGTLFMDSCKRSNSASGDGILCVNRLEPKAGDIEVSAAELDSIVSLFSANNLSTANLEFQSWVRDTVANIDSSQNNYVEEQVSGTAFINGLPVFSDIVFFTFKEGNFLPGSSQTGFSGEAPSADTSGHQTPASLRTAFLAHVSESSFSGGAANSKPFIPSASSYMNACLNVTLGYLDASAVPGSGYAANKALVKVWLVTPSPDSSNSYRPIVYVEDSGGLAWGMPFYGF